MGLIEELATPPVSTRVQCAVALVLAEMDTATADALRGAIASQAWRASVLSRTLAENGITLKDEAIQRHRRGDCRCR